MKANYATIQGMEAISMKPMKLLSLGLAAAMTLSLCGCGDAASGESAASNVPEASAAPTAEALQQTEMAASIREASAAEPESSDEETEAVDYSALVSGYDVDFSALTFDENKWVYDGDNDAYYQLGVGYCAAPAAVDYETLAVVVPVRSMHRGRSTALPQRRRPWSCR